jgi:hypothetical protein
MATDFWQCPAILGLMLSEKVYGDRVGTHVVGGLKASGGKIGCGVG